MARTLVRAAVERAKPSGQRLPAYRDSALSAGKAGAIHGGDRLPWARTSNSDNFDTLACTDWQLHVYGTISGILTAWCASRLAVHVFSWEQAHEKAGFMKDAMYLIRPDGYIALLAAAQDPAPIERYLAERDLSLPLGAGPIGA